MELHHHTILHQTSYLHNSRTKRSAVTRTGLVQYYIISHYTTKQPELIWFNSNPFLPSLYQVRDPEIKYHFRYLTLLAFSRLKSINQNWNGTEPLANTNGIHKSPNGICIHVQIWVGFINYTPTPVIWLQVVHKKWSCDHSCAEWSIIYDVIIRYLDKTFKEKGPGSHFISTLNTINVNQTNS